MILLNRITEVNGYPLKEKWYEAARIASPAQIAQVLHEAWGTANKDRGPACSRCKGRGYTRADENVGCHVCLGTGVTNEG